MFSEGLKSFGLTTSGQTAYQILNAVEGLDSLPGHANLFQVLKRVEVLELRDAVSLKYLR